MFWSSELNKYVAFIRTYEYSPAPVASRANMSEKTLHNSGGNLVALYLYCVPRYGAQVLTITSRTRTQTTPAHWASVRRDESGAA